MDSNHDKLRELMSESNQPLPPELDWSQMQDGILAKMDEIESSKSTPKHHRNKLVGVVILLATLILCIPMHCNDSISNDTINDSAISIHPTVDNMPEMEKKDGNFGQVKSEFPIGNSLIKSKGIINDDNKKDVILEASGISNTNTFNQVYQYLNTHSNKVQSYDFNNKPKKEISSFEEKPSINIPVTANDIFEEKPGSWKATSPVHHVLDNEIISTSSQVNNIYKPVEILSKEEFYMNAELAVISLDTMPPGFILDTIFPPVLIGEVKRRNRLSLLAGVSAWNMGYGNTETERKDYERTTISYHAGINYIHPLKKNYTLMIGFHYQQLESRFDWSASLDDHTITLTDTIVQIQTNTLTGQQVEIRGDIELTVPATRMLRHHNKIQLYQIPFAVGKTWTLANKWQTDILIGGVLGMISENKGRTLYQNDILDYTRTSNDIYNNQLKFNVMLEGRLSYNINAHWGITTSIQFQRSLTNWSAEKDVKIYPNVLNGGIGLQYSF
ncbi:MAG: hypothetical protein ACI94Y_004040 [Maribacter sp.]